MALEKGLFVVSKLCWPLQGGLNTFADKKCKCAAKHAFMHVTLEGRVSRGQKLHITKSSE